MEDLHHALGFYHRLGLDTAEGAAYEPHAETVPASGLRVAWDPVALTEQIDPPWRTAPAGGHRVTLAFGCLSSAEVDAKYTELAALGHGHKELSDAFWGQGYAVVKDPDGNPVNLFAPL